MLQIHLTKSEDVVLCNDLFFNMHTYTRVLGDIILQRKMEQVEGVSYLGSGQILSKFTDSPIGLEFLSTGCKTLLNIMAFPDKTFSVLECDLSIRDEIFRLREGNIYSSCILIPRFESDLSYRIVQGIEIYDTSGIKGLMDWRDKYAR